MSIKKDKIQLDIEINGKKSGSTYKELQDQARQLNNELKQLVPGTQAFVNKSADLQRVNTRLADIRAQTRAVGNAMDEAKIKSGLFGNAFSNALRFGAGFAAAQVGISSIIGLLKESFTKYADAAKIDAQTKAALESTGGTANRTFEQLKNGAKELSKITLFSGGQIQEAQNFLLTFTKISDGIYDRAIPAILDYSTAFKIDLKAASVQVGKALNDPIKGMTALSKAGVQFTVEQKAMVKSLVESGDLAGAQTIILKELETQFKGSAKAAADAGLGPYEMFKKQLNAIKKSLGEVLFKGFDLVKPALSLFLNLFQKGIGILISFVLILSKVPEFIKENKVAIGALLVALISFNAQAIAATANTLRMAAVQKAQTIYTYALAVAQRVLNAAMKANPIGLIVTAISLLIGGLLLAYKNSEKFRAVLDGLGNVAKEFFRIFMEGFKALGAGWDLIKEGKIGAGMKKFGEGLTKLNPVGIALTEGKRLGDAFNKGYADSLAKSTADKEAKAYEKKVQASKKNKTNTGRVDGTDEEIDAEGVDLSGGTGTGKKSKGKSGKSQSGGYGAPGMIDAILMGTAALKKAYQERVIEAQKAAISQEQALQTELDQLKAFGLQETELYRQKEEALAKLKKDAEDKAQAEKLKIIQDALAAELGEAEKQFLQKMINEDQYNEMILQIKAEAIQKELDLMKLAGQGETAAFKEKELELTRVKAEGVKQRTEAEQKYSESYQTLMQNGSAALNDAFQLGIDLLGKDEAARKKNAGAIKAFQKGQVLINTAMEISGIWRNANTAPVNAIIPGWAQIWAGIQTGLAVARAGVQIAKINAVQFAGGGYTGSGGKYEPAGIVHRSEYVLTKEEVREMGGPVAVEGWKRIAMRGYAGGGVVTDVDTTPVGMVNVPIGSVAPQDNGMVLQKLDTLIGVMSRWPTLLRAFVALDEFEAKQADKADTLRRAQI